MTLNRFVRKARFSLLKSFVGVLVYFNHRVYMRLYSKVLRDAGIKLKGTPRFIAKSATFDDFELISLGDRVVISMNVKFLTHDYSYTTALISIDEKPNTDIGVVRGITVGDNVFIGMNSILLPGTTIGNNVIIGAGSVVRGQVSDFSVLAGNPATWVADIRDHARKINSTSHTLRVDVK